MGHVSLLVGVMESLTVYIHLARTLLTGLLNALLKARPKEREVPLRVRVSLENSRFVMPSIVNMCTG